MYAHKVLESIVEEEEIVRIKSSVKFHVDGNFVLSYKKSRSDALRAGKTDVEFLKRYCKLPYSLVWIDTVIATDVDKIGLGILAGYAPYEDLPQAVQRQCTPEDGPFVWCYRYATGDNLSKWINIGSAIMAIGRINPEVTGFCIFLNELPFNSDPTALLTLAVFESTLLFLNCKNVVVNIVNPPEKLNKKRLRKGKLPIFTYRTLHLPSHSVLKSGEKQESLGNHNRIHLCRGHFKVYTEDRPLMGRHVGMYYWEPYVRGQNKKGVIVKDYHLEGSPGKDSL